MRQILTFLLFLTTFELMVGVDFRCTKDGLFPDKTDRHKYIECSNGRAFPFQCPDGTVFNETSLECVFDNGETDPPTVQSNVTTPTSTNSTVTQAITTGTPASGNTTGTTWQTTGSIFSTTKVVTGPTTGPTNPPTSTSPPITSNPPTTSRPITTNPPTTSPPITTNPPTKSPPITTNPPTTSPPITTNKPITTNPPPSSKVTPTIGPNKGWEFTKLSIENALFHLKDYMTNIIHDANQLISDPKEEPIKLMKKSISDKILSIEKLENEISAELKQTHTPEDMFFLEESKNTLALYKNSLKDLDNKLKV